MGRKIRLIDPRLAHASDSFIPEDAYLAKRRASLR